MDLQYSAGFVSELIGTMVLILFGNGVVAAMNFKNMYAKKTMGNWMVIITGWGFAVYLGVIISSAIFSAMNHQEALIGTAHLNPAVTVAFLVKAAKSDVIGHVVGLSAVYILAQFLGAALGQALLNFINYKHIIENPSAVLKGSSCTGPSHRDAYVQNFSYELVGTMLLVGGVLAVGSSGLAGSLNVTFVVMAIGLSLGSVTGYAINPARDLAPRVVYHLTSLVLKDKLAMQGEVVSPDYAYGLSTPFAAPLVGGAIVGAIALAA